MGVDSTVTQLWADVDHDNRQSNALKLNMVVGVVMIR